MLCPVLLCPRKTVTWLCGFLDSVVKNSKRLQPGYLLFVYLSPLLLNGCSMVPLRSPLSAICSQASVLPLPRIMAVCQQMEWTCKTLEFEIHYLQKTWHSLFLLIPKSWGECFSFTNPMYCSLSLSLPLSMSSRKEKCSHPLHSTAAFLSFNSYL